MDSLFEETWFYAPLRNVGDRARLADEEASHLRKVLRIKTGTNVLVSNGQGQVFECETFDGAGAVEVLAVALHRLEPQPPQLNLVLGLLKGRDLEEPVEAVCQLPVQSIHLVTTDFSQEFRHQEYGRLMERLRQKSLAGLKQAKKTWLTTVHPPVPLREWGKAHEGGTLVLAHPGPDQLPSKPEGDFYLLIGPEGGFSPDELGWLLNGKKCHTLGLGDTRIRAVTAPLLACGKLMGLGWV